MWLWFAEQLFGQSLTVIVKVGEREGVLQKRAENLRDLGAHRLPRRSVRTRRSSGHSSRRQRRRGGGAGAGRAAGGNCGPVKTSHTRDWTALYSTGPAPFPHLVPRSLSAASSWPATDERSSNWTTCPSITVEAANQLQRVYYLREKSYAIILVKKTTSKLLNSSFIVHRIIWIKLWTDDMRSENNSKACIVCLHQGGYVTGCLLVCLHTK